MKIDRRISQNLQPLLRKHSIAISFPWPSCFAIATRDGNDTVPVLCADCFQIASYNLEVFTCTGFFSACLVCGCLCYKPSRKFKQIESTGILKLKINNVLINFTSPPTAQAPYRLPNLHFRVMSSRSSHGMDKPMRWSGSKMGHSNTAMWWT